MNKVKNISRTLLSNQWARLNKIEYDYQFENGDWKRLARESYNRGNGTCILLFNKSKNTVILTRQFRMPAYENDINDGMLVEVCAGALDKDESPESCIIREVEEEVGYKIDTVKLIMNTYMSPGAVTEKMHFFIAEYKDEMRINGGGGLKSEDEEIEVLELSFKDAIKMIGSGEIIDAKTVILLQYAQINEIVTCKN